ncbi:hypothetical protein HDV05_003048, partial [Chytridiales sp. JEL 0842]
GEEKGATDGFRVKPAAKHYRFTAKPKHRILTTEEAEETLKKKTNQGERWMMQKKKEEMPTDEPVLKKEEMEVINRVLKRTQFKIGAGINQKGRASNDLEEELDYDDINSDDENPDFGIEDEDEAKEARKREFGDMLKKAQFSEDEVDDELDGRKRNKVAKSLKKTLKKLNKDGMIISDDEKDPYNSED